MWRQDSPEYVAARSKMNQMAAQATGMIYGQGPFEDHHGGALWLQDSQGWFMVRNQAGIEWSAQFCLSGDAKVLTADLRWIPLRDVFVGHFLLGFDEESRPGQWRRWRPADVLARRIIERPCYDLLFDDGTRVRASAEHRWLVGHGGAHVNADWVTTEGLASHNCADPAKVDLLRQNAKRLYDLVAPQIKQQLDPDGLLEQPIQDAAGVAKWTDSIFNAGVPLHPSFHTGVLPGGGAQSPAAGTPPPATGAQAAPAAGAPAPPAAENSQPAGVHHYPTPIVDIQLFMYDDFQLWVTDQQGNPAAVVPVDKRGSGNASVHVLYATPGSQLAQQNTHQNALASR
jgi:hypothetical protein